MRDWLRSFAALGLAFSSVLAFTLWLALTLVPNGVPTPDAGEADASDGPAAASDPPLLAVVIPGLGGDLIVTGDHDATVSVEYQAPGERYGLVGDDARLFFDANPFGLAQINVEGLSFFPKPGECTVTPLNLETAVGVAKAEIICETLAEVRGRGVVSLRGTIGLHADVLAGMGLPNTGGTVTVGDETWTFEKAALTTWRMPMRSGIREFNMELVDAAAGGALRFVYDLDARRVFLAAVDRGGEIATITDADCQLQHDALGNRDHRTTVVEMTITCEKVDVPGLGEVRIHGTVIVDRLEYPV